MVNMDVMSMVWRVVWVLLLWFVGLWLSMFCAFFYIIANIFAPCFGGCIPITELLLKGVQFTGLCGQGIAEGTPLMEAFK